MPINEEETARTELLLAASTQHLRLTLEELPVGTIAVTDQGVIENIDGWVERRLEFDEKSLPGCSIASIFEDSASHVLELMRNRIYGFAGQLAMRTRSGSIRVASIALMPGSYPRQFIFSVICTNGT